jgi:8-hydroxy-5-deazaflavin:NADPH oxidoreductase
MKIAIIGAGEMGSALARDLAEAGHPVTIGSRDADRAQAIAGRVGAASGGGYEQAAAASEVVVLTVPWQAVRQIVPGLPLDGKILIDATNPYLDDSFDGRESVWSVREEFPAGESGASVIQALAPGASVVKAFNHIWAVTAQRGFGETRPAVFVCGDDASARTVVMGLAADIGYDPHDAGGLERARWLEALTPLVVALEDPNVALTVEHVPPR